jgi:hypothetical protein
VLGLSYSALFSLSVAPARPFVGLPQFASGQYAKPVHSARCCLGCFAFRENLPSFAAFLPRTAEYLLANSYSYLKRPWLRSLPSALGSCRLVSERRSSSRVFRLCKKGCFWLCPDKLQLSVCTKVKWGQSHSVGSLLSRAKTMHLQACHLPWPLYVSITRYALAKLGAAESRGRGGRVLERRIYQEGVLLSGKNMSN